MKNTILRGLLSCLFVTVFGVVAFHAMQAPSLPFLKLSLYRVDRVIVPQDVGDIQQFDALIRVNGEPFFGCMYLGANTPIYNAPRNVPVPIEVERLNPDNQTTIGTGERVLTHMILRDPSVNELFARGAIVILALTFLATGIVVLFNGDAKLDQVLVAASMMVSSLVILGGPHISDFEAPYSFIYWLGIPIWGMLILVTDTRWPVDQRKRKASWSIVGLFALVGMIITAMTVMGVPINGCKLQGQLYDVWGYLYNGLLLFSLGGQLFLLGRAFVLADAPYERTQIRALIVAVAIGLGAPILLSVLPLTVGVPWVAPPEIMLLAAIVIPITIMVTMTGTRSGVRIEKYVGRITFYSLLFVFWAGLSFFAINVYAYWLGQPDPLESVALATVPVMLFLFVLRQPYGRWLDILLYGKHYEYEEVAFRLIQTLSRLDGLDQIAAYLAATLPSELFITRVSLWRRDGADGTTFRCIGSEASCKGLPELWQPPLTITGNGITKHQDEGVVLFEKSLAVGEGLWDALIYLSGVSGIEGVMLIGPKVNRRYPYSEKDVRILSLVGNWLGTYISSRRLLEEQEEQEREQLLALVKHEDRIREEVAGLLHDDGISSIGVVRKMVDRGQDPQIIHATLQRIVDNMRKITRTHLVPAGLDLGLQPAIMAVVREREAIGSHVNAEFRLPSEEMKYLRGVIARDLYYLTREAITNAKNCGDDVSVFVEVFCENDEFVVRVRDEGPGFDVSTILAGGRIEHGLGFMRARAIRIGADLSIESKLGVGTTITARLPLALIEREMEESLVAELAQ